MISPHHLGKSMPISTILSNLASQEGCDGEPYDQMEEASNYIRELELRVEELKKENKILNYKLNPYLKPVTKDGRGF